MDKYLVVGLGNLGLGYIYIWHNAGFYFLDAFADAQGWRFAAARMQGEAAQGRLGGAHLCCVKPQTFMNHSGLCVRRYLDYFDIPLARLIVLHDDLDLAAGRIKVMRGGGAGGHNGIRSLIEHLKSRDFARIRIGIGRPPGPGGHDEAGIVDYVLAPLGMAGRRLWDERVPLVNEALELFISQGVDACMNSINGRGAA